MKIQIHQCPYNEGEVLFSKSIVELKPGVTVLVGCNGFGKSTLLREIRDVCRKENVAHIMFDNYHDGGSNSRSALGFYGQFDELAARIMSSEGEEIYQNFGRFVSGIGKFIHSNQDRKQLVILIDAIDSGMSIDNIREVKDLFKLVLDDNKDKEIYFIVSANSYEMASGQECLDPYNGEYCSFENYDHYADFIMYTSKAKADRYESQKPKGGNAQDEN